MILTPAVEDNAFVFFSQAIERRPIGLLFIINRKWRMGMKRERKPLSAEEQIYAKGLIEQYDKLIRKVIRTHLHREFTTAEFEDVVQNVFEDICCRLKDFPRYDSPEALVVTIAKRAAWKAYREQKKETLPLREDYPAREEDRGLEDILPAKLSQQDRQLLIRTYQNLETSMEVAEDMGEKPTTIRQRLSRARKRLEELL